MNDSEKSNDILKNIEAEIAKAEDLKKIQKKDQRFRSFIFLKGLSIATSCVIAVIILPRFISSSVLPDWAIFIIAAVSIVCLVTFIIKDAQEVFRTTKRNLDD